MVRCGARTHPSIGEGLYVVELPGRRLDCRGPRSATRPHLGIARAQGCRQQFRDSARCARMEASVGPCPGDGHAGGLEAWPAHAAGPRRQPLSFAPAIMMLLAI